MSPFVFADVYGSSPPEGKTVSFSVFHLPTTMGFPISCDPRVTIPFGIYIEPPSGIVVIISVARRVTSLRSQKARKIAHRHHPKYTEGVPSVFASGQLVGNKA